MSSFIGTWVQTKLTNFDEYLKVLGCPPELITAAKTGNLKMIISKNGDVWNMKFETDVDMPGFPKLHEWNFLEGQPFEDTYGGIPLTWTIKSDGPNKMVSEQKTRGQSGELVSTITSEIVNDEMIDTYVLGDTKATRTFRRN